MKLLGLVAVTALLSTTAFGQPIVDRPVIDRPVIDGPSVGHGNHLEAEARRLAREVNDLTRYNVDTLTQSDKNRLVSTLRRAKDILEGRTVPGPGPGPGPGPRPYLACSEANGFIRDFTLLKDFAYSSKGLNYNSIQARQYALNNVQVAFSCPRR